jgi:hypothetical protein
MTTLDSSPTRAPFPEIGSYLPIVVLRGLIAVVLAGTGLLLLPNYLPASLAFCVGVLMVVVRRVPLGWILMTLLAVTVLAYDTEPSLLRVAFTVAAIHAVHELGSILVWLPTRGRIQLVILGRVLRRYVLIEVPTQVIVAVTYALAVPSTASRLANPVFGLAAAIALLLLVALIVVPRLRHRAGS